MGTNMRTLVLIVSCSALLLSGCPAYVVTGGGKESPDGNLIMSVVTRIGPGQTEREHRIFVGIGDRSDNPANKYLRREYSFKSSRDVTPLVTWQGSDRVTLTIGEREYGAPDNVPPPRTLAQYTYARPPGSLMFEEVR